MYHEASSVLHGRVLLIFSHTLGRNYSHNKYVLSKDDLRPASHQIHYAKLCLSKLGNSHQFVRDVQIDRTDSYGWFVEFDVLPLLKVV